MLERRTLPSGVTALVSTVFEEHGFLAAFTERSGGTSTGSFRSLNVGSRSADDPAAVAANRVRVCRALEVSSFACAEQVHGGAGATIGPERAGAGFDRPDSAIAGVDALATAASGVALAVVTADCVPLALADPEGGRLAVVHAGWRGVAAGVVATAVAGFDHPESILAVIGPAVGPDHYEVGDDVARAVAAATEEGPVTTRTNGRLRLDLPATVARILTERGVRLVEREPVCTACEVDRFFSHRRDGETGRQALVAVRR
jgi:YfiH family protein